jgi:hypothetical protein
MVRSFALVLCILLASCDRLPFGVSAEESATRACEERLKGDLTSPSSYRRVWSSFTPAAPATKAEEIEKDEADRVRALRSGDDGAAIIATFDRNRLQHPNKECGFSYDQSPHPNTAFVLVQYEAGNAFNAQLPGYFTCRMTSRDDGKYTLADVFTASELSRQQGEKLKALSRTS